MRRLLIALSLLCCANAPSSYAYTTDTIDALDTLWVNGDGYTSGWFPSGGDYIYVDETQIPGDSLTTYMESRSNGQISTFTFYPWTGYGVTNIDSLVLSVYSYRTNAAAKFQQLIRVNGSNSLSGVDVSNSAWAWDTDKWSTSGWTEDSVNLTEIGCQSVGGSLTKNARVTQQFAVLYYQQVVLYDTLDTELYDAYISDAQATYNYGNKTPLWIGNLSGTTYRTAFYVDTIFRKRFPYWHAIIDTALLVFKTSNVYTGGNHDIQAHIIDGNSLPGSSAGAAPDSAVTWSHRNYHSTADYRIAWQIAGIDSTGEDGGSDRHADYTDSINIAATGTDTMDVSDWLIELTSSGIYPQATLPSGLLLRQLSEVSTDSTIEIYSREYGTAADRPFIYVRATQIDTSGVGLPGGEGAADSVVHSGMADVNERVFITAFRDSLGSLSATSMGTMDTTYLVGVTSGSYWGMYKGTDKNANDWVSGEYRGAFIQFGDILRFLHDTCLCDDVSDTTLIQSVYFYWGVTAYNPKRDASPIGGWVKYNFAGPILQTVSPAPYSGWGTFDASANFRDAADSVFWRTEGARYTTSGIVGDTIVDYDSALTGWSSPDTTAWDISYDSSGFVSYTVDNQVIVKEVDVTRMFINAMLARARDGSATGDSYLDTLGFVMRAYVSNSATSDSFTANVDNRRAGSFGAGDTVQANYDRVPSLRVYLNQGTVAGRCATENPVEGTSQVIIIQ